MRSSDAAVSIAVVRRAIAGTIIVGFDTRRSRSLNQRMTAFGIPDQRLSCGVVIALDFCAETAIAPDRGQ